MSERRFSSWQCPKCSFGFKNVETLRRHADSHHNCYVYLGQRRGEFQLYRRLMSPIVHRGLDAVNDSSSFTGRNVEVSSFRSFHHRATKNRSVQNDALPKSVTPLSSVQSPAFSPESSDVKSGVENKSASSRNQLTLKSLDRSTLTVLTGGQLSPFYCSVPFQMQRSSKPCNGKTTSIHLSQGPDDFYPAPYINRRSSSPRRVSAYSLYRSDSPVPQTVQSLRATDRPDKRSTGRRSRSNSPGLRLTPSPGNASAHQEKNVTQLVGIGQCSIDSSPDRRDNRASQAQPCTQHLKSHEESHSKSQSTVGEISVDLAAVKKVSTGHFQLTDKHIFQCGQTRICTVDNTADPQVLIDSKSQSTGNSAMFQTQSHGVARGHEMQPQARQTEQRPDLHYPSHDQSHSPTSHKTHRSVGHPQLGQDPSRFPALRHPSSLNRNQPMNERSRSPKHHPTHSSSSSPDQRPTRCSIRQRDRSRSPALRSVQHSNSGIKSRSLGQRDRSRSPKHHPTHSSSSSPDQRPTRCSIRQRDRSRSPALRSVQHSNSGIKSRSLGQRDRSRSPKHHPTHSSSSSPDQHPTRCSSRQLGRSRSPALRSVQHSNSGIKSRSLGQRDRSRSPKHHPTHSSSSSPDQHPTRRSSCQLGRSRSPALQSVQHSNSGIKSRSSGLRDRSRSPKHHPTQSSSSSPVQRTTRCSIRQRDRSRSPALHDRCHSRAPRSAQLSSSVDTMKQVSSGWFSKSPLSGQNHSRSPNRPIAFSTSRLPPGHCEKQDSQANRSGSIAERSTFCSNLDSADQRRSSDISATCSLITSVSTRCLADTAESSPAGSHVVCTGTLTGKENTLKRSSGRLTPSKLNNSPSKCAGSTHSLDRNKVSRSADRKSPSHRVKRRPESPPGRIRSQTARNPNTRQRARVGRAVSTLLPHPRADALSNGRRCPTNIPSRQVGGSRDAGNPRTLGVATHGSFHCSPDRVRLGCRGSTSQYLGLTAASNGSINSLSQEPSYTFRQLADAFIDGCPLSALETWFRMFPDNLPPATKSAAWIRFADDHLTVQTVCRSMAHALNGELFGNKLTEVMRRWLMRFFS